MSAELVPLGALVSVIDAGARAELLASLRAVPPSSDWRLNEAIERSIASRVKRICRLDDVTPERAVQRCGVPSLQLQAFYRECYRKHPDAI